MGDSVSENFQGSMTDSTADILPRYEEAVIPLKKFTEYCLNYDKAYDKALTFELALGYTIEHASLLIENIRGHLSGFPAKRKGNRGRGELYEVVMVLEGLNGKTANVLTAWIDDAATGEMRLVTAHVD
jgi:hypothetical protein